MAKAGQSGLEAVTGAYEIISRLAQQLRQLGDVGGDAPRLVTREQIRRRIYGCSARIKRPGDTEAPVGALVAVSEGPAASLGAEMVW